MAKKGTLHPVESSYWDKTLIGMDERKKTRVKKITITLTSER